MAMDIFRKSSNGNGYEFYPWNHLKRPVQVQRPVQLQRPVQVLRLNVMALVHAYTSQLTILTQ